MTPPNRHAYFPYIDGLRAIAVAAVLIYHLDSAWLPGGFAGVDVFFVISGFVVSASVGTRERSSLFRFETYFLARRIQRIAPALLVCLLGTALASALLIPQAWLSEGSQVTARYAFFGFSNLILARNANSYFSPITEYNPFTHTWSLGVEEQFYLLFPLMFWAWSFRGRWRVAVTGLFAVVGVASLVYAWTTRSADPLAAFYLLPSRLWELAAGVVLYQAMALFGNRFEGEPAVGRRPWLACAAWLALAATFVGLATADADRFPVPGALLVVVGTIGMLGILQRVSSGSWLVLALTWRPVRVLGQMSYSLYLWHWPVFVLFRWTVGVESGVHRLMAVAIALFLAFLSWRFVENPARRASWLVRAPRLVVVVCGVLALFVGARLARTIDHRQPAWSLSVVAKHADDWYPTKDQSLSSPDGCKVEPRPAQVGPGVRVAYEREGCSSPVSGPRVFAIGDSHAMAFGSLFAMYAMQTGAPVALYNNGGCPFLSLQPWREADAHCQASTASALDDMLTRLRPGDVVFLPSLRMPRFVDQFAVMSPGSVDDQLFGVEKSKARDDAVLAAADTIRRLSAAGAHVVIEAPDLVLKSPAFRCADPWTHGNPICAGGMTVERDEFERLRAPVLAAVDRLASSVPGTSVFDPFPLICPPGRLCEAYRDGRPLFFDGDHLSGYANRLLLPAFVEAMRAASPGSATAPGG